ncbi:Urea ABC transporter, permease protein UrtB [hydrothermal vent metagenome]|uniref:Urea ABC transporter, permease protein UrtB n=1 Tax=hydrothermal vent metagenome TaxID=652676 RepID=A0A3B0SB95_9ZZZZ
MDIIVVILLSTLTSISVLLLASMGLAVVFGLMRIINMAHGEFLMIGAFTTVTLVLRLDLPIWVAVIGAPIASAAIGVAVELLLIRPLYGRRLVDTLLVTFGLSLVLYQLAVNVFGTASPSIPTPLGAINIGKYSVSVYSLFLPIATAAIMWGLYKIFTATKYGLMARASAQSAEMAAALGVDSAKINLITFTLGCALAGLGGGLLAPIVAVSPTLGQSYIGQAFMTVITGGQAFLIGTLASSAILGGVQSIISQVFTTFWGVAGLFLTAIVLIRFLPQGLSGRWKRQM